MHSDALLREILAELRGIREELSIVQQDLNAIRNGEYEAPQGVDTTPPREPASTQHREFETDRNW